MHALEGDLIPPEAGTTGRRVRDGGINVGARERGGRQGLLGKPKPSRTNISGAAGGTGR